ncbi:MAG: hypothetical protein ACREUW_14155 [Burkholderiales bacterium]
MINAHFFWHGPALSLYETACLTSFVQQGIAVNLHTFNHALKVPQGVTLRDAAVLARPEEVLAYTQGGHAQSIAAFTDIFRYRVLSRAPGWWFDTDVFCLAPAQRYAELQTLSKGLLLGLEEAGKVNGAVLYVSDPALAQDLERRAEAIGKVFEWGAIGPGLVTKFMQAFPDRVTALDRQYFYPIHYLEVERFFRPEDCTGSLAACEGAVCVHLWNEFLRRWRIPKNLLPCEGSYLAGLFAGVGVSVAPSAALPNDTFEALRHNGEIGRVGHKALRVVRGLKKVKAAVTGR